MTHEEFEAYFDCFTSTVFRLETLQDYGDAASARRSALLSKATPLAATSAAPSAASFSSGGRFAAIICQSFLRERTDLHVTQRSG